MPDEVFYADPVQLESILQRERRETEAQMLSPAPGEDPGEEAGCDLPASKEPEGAPEHNLEPEEPEPEEPVLCKESSLDQLVKMLVNLSKNWSLEELMALHHELKARLDTDFIRESNRERVLAALKHDIDHVQASRP